MWNVWRWDYPERCGVLAERPAPCLESTLWLGHPAVCRVCIISHPERLHCRLPGGKFQSGPVGIPVSLEQILNWGGKWFIYTSQADPELKLLKGLEKMFNGPTAPALRRYQLSGPTSARFYPPSGTPGDVPWLQASSELLSPQALEGFLSAENQTGLH